MSDQRANTIADDVWLRLALLDSRCVVRIFSTRDFERRYWTVLVRGRDDQERRFETRGATMREAVIDAVTEAERRGMV